MNRLRLVRIVWKVVGVVSLLVASGGRSAWAVDPMDAQSLQVRKYFINANASALTSGTAVVLSLADANLVTGTTKGGTSNLGLHITTTTVANSTAFVGVIHQDSCASLGVCEVVTYGPAIALVECSTSNPRGVGITQLGTGTVAGQLGSGTRAGLLLSPSLDTGDVATGTDGCRKWVFVSPQAAD